MPRISRRCRSRAWHCWHLSLPDLSAAHGGAVNLQRLISRSRRFGLRVNTESIPGTVRRDANCTTTSARPAARRSAGLSIYVQISLALRLGASTTGISRPRRRRSGRKRCALGQHCQRAFSISRALDRFRARAKRFPTPTRWSNSGAFCCDALGRYWHKVCGMRGQHEPRGQPYFILSSPLYIGPR